MAAAERKPERTAEAIPLLEKNLADCERVLGPDDSGTLVFRANLADAYEKAGRTAEAIPLHEKALADQVRLPNVCRVTSNSPNADVTRNPVCGTMKILATSLPSTRMPYAVEFPTVPAK